MGFGGQWTLLDGPPRGGVGGVGRARPAPRGVARGQRPKPHPLLISFCFIHPQPPAATPTDQPTPLPPTVGLTLAAIALTAALALTPPPAHADLPTVTLEEATAAAKPLPQQTVRTGRVWALIGLGAAGVFGAAIAVENNAAWFPAIAKANKAMAATKARAAIEGGAARAEATGSGTDAVAAGIAEASRRARDKREEERTG